MEIVFFFVLDYFFLQWKQLFRWMTNKIWFDLLFDQCRFFRWWLLDLLLNFNQSDCCTNAATHDANITFQIKTLCVSNHGICSNINRFQADLSLNLQTHKKTASIFIYFFFFSIYWICILTSFYRRHTFNFCHLISSFELFVNITCEDSFKKTTCRASFDALGVRILSIHWYSGSSFTTSSSTNPWMTCAWYPYGMIGAKNNVIEWKQISENYILLTINNFKCKAHTVKKLYTTRALSKLVYVWK